VVILDVAIAVIVAVVFVVAIVVVAFVATIVAVVNNQAVLSCLRNLYEYMKAIE